jgi:hypothetical protein
MKKLVLIGLCLNILGTILIWKFGLPPDVNRHGHQALVIETTDQSQVITGKRYDALSHLGMGFIFSGFVLQAIAVYREKK